MTRILKAALAGLTALAVIAVVLPAPLTAGQAAERTVYVSVMDANGQPVQDMKLAEFTVTEDGEARTITKVERATEPIHYALLIDTTPTSARAVSDIREAVGAFCKLLLSVEPKTQFSVTDFGGAAMTILEFTSELPKIEASFARLLPKQSESVLNEALVEVAKEMAKLPPNSRRVILTINMEPTKESSNVQAKQVAEQVRKAGAVVWSVALQEGTRRDANRETLLKGLAANTGGRWVALQNQSQTQLSGYLRSIAANSFSQYAVTFTRGDEAKVAGVTNVAVSRPGAFALSMKWSNQ